jgi:hypothetical protein
VVVKLVPLRCGGGAHAPRLHGPYFRNWAQRIYICDFFIFIFKNIKFQKYMSIWKNFKNKCLPPPNGSCRPSKERHGPFYNKNIYVQISENLFVIKIITSRSGKAGRPTVGGLGDWGAGGPSLQDLLGFEPTRHCFSWFSSAFLIWSRAELPSAYKHPPY